MAANDQLTALDATFLELEEADDSALMHIGAALVFDPARRRWDAGDWEGARAPRAPPVGRLPRYRQKLSAPRTGGLAEHSVGIAVVSYAGGVTFGLYADRATVPDVDVLREGILTSLVDLAEFAEATPAGR